MRIKISLIGLLLLSIVLAGDAFAMDQASFMLNTLEVEMCPCKTTLVLGEIVNNENIPQEFRVVADKEWVTVAPNTFKLGPFERENIYVYITPFCNIDAGDYVVKITVEGVDAGDSKIKIEKEIKVKVLPCHVLSLEALPSRIEGCAGDSVEINLSVKNLGISPENVIITSNYGRLSEEKVMLDAGDEKSVQLAVPLDPDMKEVVIQATSASSYASASIIIPSGVINCYRVELKSEEEVIYGCARTPTKAVFAVENTGLKEDAYAITVSEGKTNTSWLKLKPGETGYFEIELYKEKEGEYEVKVSADSTHAHDEKSLKFVIRDCSGVAVVVLPKEAEICADETKDFLVAVKNIGVSTEKFELEANVGELAETEQEIAPGDVWATKLMIDARELSVGENVVSASVKNRKNDKQEVRVLVHSMDECYGFNISVDKTAVRMDETRGYLVELEIKNTGLKKMKFHIDYKAPAWVMVNPEELEIDSGESKKVFVYATPEYNLSDGVYEVGLTVRNEKDMKASTVIYFLKGDVTIEEVIKQKTQENKRKTPITTGILTKSTAKRVTVSVIVAVAVVFLLLILPDIIKRREKKKGEVKKEEKKKRKDRDIEDVKKILESI